MKRMIALLLLLCMLTACVAPVPETEEPTAASQEIAVPEQKQPDSGTMTGAATFTQAASGPLTYTVVLKTLEDSAAAADGTTLAVRSYELPEMTVTLPDGTVLTEAASPAETAAPAAKPAKSRGRRLWDDYGYLLVTLAAVFVLFKVLLQLAYVPSGSMETTIPTKCLLVGWRLPYLVSDPVPDRGDIVTFWDEELNKVLVKRVVGLPGETLSFKNGYTYVNGEKLDESYLPTQGITTLPDSMADKTFTVPEGCMFVMGDNRTGSNDSRLLGEPYIPIEAVQARMLVAISVGSDQSWQGIRWIG